MRLKIDCYSENEYAIRGSIKSDELFKNQIDNELFVFACYTLRQLKNLGQIPMALAATTLLCSQPIALAYNPKMKNIYKFPNHNEISKLGDQVGLEVRLPPEIDSILVKPVTLVKYKGNTKKFFDLSCPPINLTHKGFGFLGLNVNIYVVSSIICLILYFAQKHSDNQEYLNDLSQLAAGCGFLNVGGKIPFGDQSELARSMILHLREVKKSN